MYTQYISASDQRYDGAPDEFIAVRTSLLSHLTPFSATEFCAWSCGELYEGKTLCKV